MRTFVKLTSVFVIVFVMFCIGGMGLGREKKPLIDFEPCYKGYMPHFAFSANKEFLWDMTTPQFGPKYSRFNLYVIGWPGGGIVTSVNEAGICLYNSEEETELAVLNVYWKTPASNDDEPEVGVCEVEKEHKD